ncbi:hypothetical protein, partial [Streptomyces sp. NPDC057199]|uniref:hypothetical protein n=1 Tax=Streptomyces sp. NPDC057199 TaxID=3346047 RepID=UPI003637680D
RLRRRTRGRPRSRSSPAQPTPGGATNLDLPAAGGVFGAADNQITESLRAALKSAVSLARAHVVQGEGDSTEAVVELLQGAGAEDRGDHTGMRATWSWKSYVGLMGSDSNRGSAGQGRNSVLMARRSSMAR